MLRSSLTVLVVLASMSPAPAFQKFEQYRILGSEILSVRLGPMEVEDPATLILELTPNSSGPGEITIESDAGLDACKATVEEILGSATSTVEITVQVTADTMNGVMVIQCARIPVAGT
tara:strand:+ start:3161 stop:3514 length:354 start_codon:yes stop_codon:yes gene_type:complete